MRLTNKPVHRDDRSEGDGNRSARRRRWQSRHLDGETSNWLEKDARYFLHQSLSTPCLSVR